MKNNKKQVIKIPNRRGEVLFGILTSPSAEVPKRRVLIIFSQVGVVTKTGMGDHLRILSDALASEGFTTLRFDQHGTGDSSGELPSGMTIPQFFRKVQSGFFKEDLLDIIEWAQNYLSDYRIFLLGECGGCLSAVFACVEYVAQIAGLALLAMPVLLYPLESGEKELRDFDAQIVFKSYSAKILNPMAWIRFLAGRSDTQLIKQFLQVFFKRYRKRMSSSLTMRKAIFPDHKRFNWKFWEAFQAIVKAGIPVNFLMPDLDNETFEFNAEFKEKVLDKEKKYSNCCKITRLPQTDHSIMFQESRQYLFRQLLGWLQEQGCDID